MRKARVLKSKKLVDVLRICLLEKKQIAFDFEDEYGDNAFFTSGGCYVGDAVVHWFGEAFEDSAPIALRPVIQIEPGAAKTNDYLVFNGRIFKMTNNRFAISVGSVEEFICEKNDAPDYEVIIGALVDWDLKYKIKTSRTITDFVDKGLYLGLPVIRETFDKVAAAGRTFEHTVMPDDYWTEVCEKALALNIPVVVFYGDNRQMHDIGFLCEVLSITEDGDGKYLVAFEKLGISFFKDISINTNLFSYGTISVLEKIGDFGNEESDDDEEEEEEKED